MLLFFETWFIVLMLIFVPPFGVFLTFKYSEWEKKIKIIATILSVVWLLGLVGGGVFLLTRNNDDIDNPVIEQPVPENPNNQNNPVIEDPNNTENSNNVENPNNTENPDNTETPDNPDDTKIPDETEPDGENSNKQEDTVEKNWNLTDEEVSALEKAEKIEYLLGKSFLQDKRRAYDINVNEVTKEKFDLTINITSMDNENSKDILKLVVKHLVALNYKNCIMEILINLDTGNEIKIITVRDFSTEILPTINCHIYEYGKISQEQIVFKNS